ncbi:hypothetical protein [Agromyces sp. S2-1-8]|uniref:hypothetical protein n=1 Tax=Agromyces sp. S2-1-8 TaxID=2897180 RepID=UPI001E54BD9B|nr:hypothetical protein [Agromyces sp. S2-1-8]MCD5345051.1 hypothetical protein [Agromyces sp. S2-1-8]
MADDAVEIVNGDVRLRVTGLGRTMRQLQRAGADAQDMKDLMHKVGMLIVDAANPPELTGRLASTLRAGRGKTKSVVRAGGARAPYAGVRHYGWPARNIVADPFLDEARERRRGAVLAALDAGIGEILTKNNLK